MFPVVIDADVRILLLFADPIVNHGLATLAVDDVFQSLEILGHAGAVCIGPIFETHDGADLGTTAICHSECLRHLSHLEMLHHLGHVGWQLRHLESGSDESVSMSV